MRFTAAVALFIFAAPMTAQTSRTLRGAVLDSATGETLPRATVSVEGTTISVQTNIDGRFVLIGVPAGSQTLRVQYIGYLMRRVPLDARADTAAIIVRLARSVALLQTVTARADTIQGMDAAQRVGEITVSTAQVATTPSLGEVDVFRTLQLLPGVSSANSGTSGLYVRGGTPDQNLVLFDGMTVYHVDHFFGIFSAFNADAIKDIRLFAGGYPARYGGRVSSVVDLTGKEGDPRNFRGSAGLNLLSGRFELEVPLGRGSILLAGRRSYTDVVKSSLFKRLFDSRTGSTSAPATQGGGAAAPGGGRGGGPGGFGGPGAIATTTTDPTFYFYDGNAKLTYRPTSEDVVSVSLYRGDDNLDQSTSLSANIRGGGPGGGLGGGRGATSQAASISNSEITTWGNSGASGRWFRQWNGRFSSELLGARTTYHSNSDRSSVATLAATAGNAGTLQRPAFSEHNQVDDNSLRVDNEFVVSRTLRVAGGVWLTDNRVSYAFSQRLGDTTAGGIDRDREARQTSGYVEGVWTPVARAEVTAGLRTTAYDLTEKRYVEPRLSASYRLTPSIQLRGAWGRYHQFVNRVENEDVLNGSRDFWLLADSALVPTSAEHRILGVVYDRKAYLLSVEAYDKQLDDLSIFSRRYRRVSFAADYNTLFYTGTGHARGIDVLAQKKYGALSGWISYSLSKVTSRFPDIDSGREFPASQDQRHEFKTVATYRLAGWTFSSALVFGSGTPYTSPESEYYLRLLDGSEVGFIHVGDKNGARLPAYHRLDLAAFRRFRGNNRFDWEIGASAFNVYNRQNVWYRRFDLSTTPITITDVHTLGFMPTIDVRLVLK